MSGVKTDEATAASDPQTGDAGAAPGEADEMHGFESVSGGYGGMPAGYDGPGIVRAGPANVKRMMTTVHDLTDRCFDECVFDFNKRFFGDEINGEEETCLTVCANKFLNAAKRIDSVVPKPNAKRPALGRPPSNYRR